MSQQFRAGDKVSWNTPQGKTHGKIVRRLTEDIEIEDQTIRASKEDPRYLVESDKTGARAAHKPEALSKR